MKSVVSHYEFSQTFALDPNIVNVEQLAASWDEKDHVLTVVVPKYEQIDESNQKPTLRTIPISTNTHGSTTTTTNTTTSMDATTTTTEVKEPAMAH